MDKITKPESANRKLGGPEITRCRLSLTEETLRQLKVRTGLKGGAAICRKAGENPIDY
jgi:hypothetical protein